MANNIKYLFRYSQKSSFEYLSTLPESSKTIIRLCYVTTQSYKLYLVLCSEGLAYSACTSNNGVWYGVKLNPRVAPPNKEVILQSEESLKESMVTAFYAQFPEAVESYFDDFPPCNNIKAVLNASPYLSTLNKQMCIYTLYDNVEVDVDDADGIAEILVKEGIYAVPYSKAGDDLKLQMYRALLHHDSQLERASNKWWDLFDRVVDKLKNITWGNFRRMIDEKTNP